MSIKRICSILIISLILLSCTGCKNEFIKSGSYVGVDNSDCYITVKGDTVTFDKPYFGDDSNEMYHLITYIHKLQNAEPGIILTDEEKEALKEDLPDFNPNDYIGKTYTLEFMNKETYVKGEVYDIMLWDNDTPVEILSGEYNPETGILTLCGADYSLKK